MTAAPQRNRPRLSDVVSDTPIEAQPVVRLRELIRMVHLSESTIARLEKSGDFPSRIRLGAHAVGWDRSQVLAWLESRTRGIKTVPVSKGGA